MCDIQILSDKQVTTRKIHACVWCGQRIEAGQNVRFTSGIMDGQMQSTWYHPECDDAFRKTNWDGDDMCWSFGEFGRGEVAG